jgi:cyclic pyranopterin monophosphate synthase
MSNLFSNPIASFITTPNIPSTLTLPVASTTSSCHELTIMSPSSFINNSSFTCLSDPVHFHLCSSPFTSVNRTTSRRYFSSSVSSLSFTHISDKNTPQMVDVSSKKDTLREAHARTYVDLPLSVTQHFGERDDLTEFHTPKGPVVATAIVAGTQGVKLTSHLIPFCHPLPIQDCKIEVKFERNVGESILGSEFGVRLVIDCRVKVFGKTGVEMEALCGCSVCALTIYDMCKALSHHIVIGHTRLMKKSGGKSDFEFEKE